MVVRLALLLHLQYLLPLVGFVAFELLAFVSVDLVLDGMLFDFLELAWDYGLADFSPLVLGRETV